MSRYGFSVNASSQDEDCDIVVDQLKRMVSLGKKAQTALKAIETQGYFEGMVPLAMEKTDRHWENGHQVHGHTVKYSALQQRKPFSRADLPALDNLKLVFKVADFEASYGGHECVEIPLHCTGQVARQIDPVGTIEFDEDKQKLGLVRINKHHLSFVENPSKETFHIPRRFRAANASEKDMASAMFFAKRLARMMVNTREHTLREIGMVAKPQDLQNAAPGWFVEDGVVERMFQEIHEYVTVLKVMDT